MDLNVGGEMWRSLIWYIPTLWWLKRKAPLPSQSQGCTSVWRLNICNLWMNRDCVAQCTHIAYTCKYTSGHLFSNSVMVIDWVRDCPLAYLQVLANLLVHFSAVPLFPCFFVFWSLIQIKIPNFAFYLYNNSVLMYYYNFNTIITTTFNLDWLCHQIEPEIGVMRTACYNRQVTRSEESWKEARPTIFKEIISKEGYPTNKVRSLILHL